MYLTAAGGSCHLPPVLCIVMCHLSTVLCHLSVQYIILHHLSTVLGHSPTPLVKSFQAQAHLTHGSRHSSTVLCHLYVLCALSHDPHLLPCHFSMILAKCYKPVPEPTVTLNLAIGSGTDSRPVAQDYAETIRHGAQDSW